MSDLNKLQTQTDRKNILIFPTVYMRNRLSFTHGLYAWLEEKLRPTHQTWHKFTTTLGELHHVNTPDILRAFESVTEIIHTLQ